MSNLVMIRGDGRLVDLLGRSGQGRLRFYQAPHPRGMHSTGTDERVDAVVVDLRSAERQPTALQMRKTLEAKIPVVFIIGNTPGAVRRLGDISQDPRIDFVRMAEETEEPADEVVERIQRLLRQAGTATPARSKPIASSLQHAIQDLHAPDTGRLDAGRVARLLGIPLAQLARLLGKRPGTVAKTPDAPALQPSLHVYERIVAPLLHLTGSQGRLRAWLNAPNPALEGETPMQMLLEGHSEAIAGLVENIAVGEPA